MTILPSCDAIYDDLAPCETGVRLRFVYDYNMEFANAFPSQVDCLTLLVYDQEGKYVKSYTETSEVLKDENWRLTLDLKPGQYRFEAWGGMSCEKSSFHFNGEPENLAMTALQVGVNADCLTEPKGTRLHNLFYGDLVMTIPEESTDYIEETLYMMKDTNNIRLLLQNLSGEPADGDDFIFTITDDNTLLAYNNDIVANNIYTYRPWTKGQIAAGILNNGEEAKLAFAEFSTSRLVSGNPAQLKIIRKSDSAVIVDIPLINYLLMLKSQEFNKMGDQEFLDRESRWSVIFFLDRSGNWLKTYIKVNDWNVRINDIEA